ncbi:orc1/cdc6 family replication initiation protein [Candidatus Woesearchaeota archaeon]|nr:orc1/cdc6 family replication initiation protein [Candidatus Woesearchaeota archaeon]
MRDRPVIKNLDVLAEDFVPSRLGHRDGQMKSIRDNLNPLLDDKSGRPSFIYGLPGTGKTCTSKHVAGELAEEGISHVYINCWESPSRFKIMYNLLRALGELAIHTKGTPTHELLDMLKKKLQNRQLVVILDEVDQIEDDKILYDLLTMKNITLILITNHQEALYDADPRVRSRLSAAGYIEFPRYANSEISEILHERAEWGLVPGSIKKSQVEKISENARGDCRIAIQMLRVAAEEAEAQGVPITDSHLKRAMPLAAMQKTASTVKSLNDHQSILYNIIYTSPGITPSGLQYAYIKECTSKKMEPAK